MANSKYSQLYNIVGRVFTCKFKHKDNKEKDCGYWVEIKPHASTSSLSWHSKNEHGDEVKRFFETPNKRPTEKQLESDSKRPKLQQPSISKQQSMFNFSNFSIIQ